jgi:hypothetical protein
MRDTPAVSVDPRFARVVTRAAIEDRLDGARPVGETLTALSLLPDPRMAT